MKKHVRQQLHPIVQREFLLVPSLRSTSLRTQTYFRLKQQPEIRLRSQASVLLNADCDKGILERSERCVVCSLSFLAWIVGRDAQKNLQKQNVLKTGVTGLMLPLLILVSSDRLAVMIDQITINGSVGNC